MDTGELERWGRGLAIAALVLIGAELAWSSFLMDRTTAPAPYPTGSGGSIETAIVVLAVVVPALIAVTLWIALVRYPVGEPGGRAEAIAVTVSGAIGGLLGAGFWLGSVAATVGGIMLWIADSERRTPEQPTS